MSQEPSHENVLKCLKFMAENGGLWRNTLVANDWYLVRHTENIKDEIENNGAWFSQLDLILFMEKYLDILSL